MSVEAIFADVLAPVVEQADAGELGWPLPTDHLSATQITMYQRCREQYRRRYILGERERPGAALVWGAADHYAHEQNFTQKIESHVDISEADVQTAFAEGFDRAVDRNGGVSEIEWGSDKPDELKDAGTRLVAAYHRQVSPLVQPTAVERRFTVPVEGVAVPLVGVVDVETAGPAIERKTARRASKQVEPKWRIQGLVYQLAKQRSVDWHVSVKTKTPQIVTPREAEGLTLPFVPAQVSAAERLVRTTALDMVAMWRMFGPDDAWPGAITHDWACGFCGFRKSCAWWGN